MGSAVNRTYSFDTFILDVPRGLLLRSGEEVKLRPKSYELLKYMVENRGRLLSKTELMNVIWPDTAVSDDSLAQCVQEIRRSIDGDSRTYIKTVPRRGYLFEAEVSKAENGTTPARDRAGAITQPFLVVTGGGDGLQRAWRWVLPCVATVAGLAGLLMTMPLLRTRESQSESRVVKFALQPPERTTLDTTAVSPDGRMLAFTTVGSDGKAQLWIRPLDSLTARPLAGTRGASFPFWSPDSRFVGYFAGGKLDTIAIAGGPPQTIGAARYGRGGTWGRDGVIVFAAAPNAPLSKVPASGGEVEPATSLDATRQEYAHAWPFFLPDGRHFVYLVRSVLPEHSGIYAGELNSTERTRLLGDTANASYAAAASSAGYLLFGRSGALVAQRFDARRLRLSGEPLVVAEQVGYDAHLSHSAYSVSQNGVLVYDGTERNQDQLTWFDRSGKRLGTLGEPGKHFIVSLAPGGAEVAFDLVNPSSGTPDVWLAGLAGGASRFTFDPHSDHFPVWSPDGKRIVFSSNRENAFDLYEKVADGGRPEELLLQSSQFKFATDWSFDGRFVLYHQLDPITGWDLYVLPRFGDKKPIVFLHSKYSERDGAFSPDAQWIAYTSNESGQEEIYVQAFAGHETLGSGAGGKWQVSKGGGSHPKWRRDGKELFYLSAENKIMAAQVKTGATLQHDAPRTLFDSGIADPLVNYAVSTTGDRFLIPAPMPDARSKPAIVVSDWTAGIRRRTE